MNKNAIDFDDLKKGSVISKDKIERHTNTEYGTTAFGLAALALRAEIERHFLNDHNVTISIRQTGGDMQILVDEQAVPHEIRRFGTHLMRMTTALRRMQGVDTTKLTENTHHQHDRNVEIMGKIVQAALNVEGGRMFLIEHKRAVPGLPANSKQ